MKKIILFVILFLFCSLTNTFASQANRVLKYLYNLGYTNAEYYWDFKVVADGPDGYRIYDWNFSELEIPAWTNLPSENESDEWYQLIMPQVISNRNFLVGITVSQTITPGVWTKILWDDEIDNNGVTFNITNATWNPKTTELCEVSVIIAPLAITSGKTLIVALYQNNVLFKRLVQYKSTDSTLNPPLNATVRIRPSSITNSYSVFVNHNCTSSKDIDASSTWSGNIVTGK
jgi:hypothetical protein